MISSFIASCFSNSLISLLTMQSVGLASVPPPHRQENRCERSRDRPGIFQLGISAPRSKHSAYLFQLSTGDPALPWRLHSPPSSGLTHHTCTSWPCPGSRSSRLVEAEAEHTWRLRTLPIDPSAIPRQGRGVWERAQAGGWPQPGGGCQLSPAKGVSLHSDAPDADSQELLRKRYN